MPNPGGIRALGLAGASAGEGGSGGGGREADAGDATSAASDAGETVVLVEATRGGDDEGEAVPHAEAICHARACSEPAYEFSVKKKSAR